MRKEYATSLSRLLRCSRASPHLRLTSHLLSKPVKTLISTQWYCRIKRKSITLKLSPQEQTRRVHSQTSTTKM